MIILPGPQHRRERDSSARGAKGHSPKEHFTRYQGKSTSRGPTGSAKSPPPEPREPGTLAPIAAKVIMKVFYAARVARFDLLRAIGFLACHITKWGGLCDERLHRLMCYIRTTL